MAATSQHSRRAFAWALYDFGNSAFPTVVLTFVIAAYFVKAVAPDEVTGASAWGWMNAAAALATALLSPLTGAIADGPAGRKRPLLLLSWITIAAAAGLWWARPQPDAQLLTLALVGVGAVAFELGTAVYNAMLPTVAPPGRIGRLSGLAWGLGYVGGLLCLGCALALLKLEPPPFGLDPAQAEPVRAAGPLAALWFALFTAPLFFWVPDPRPARVVLPYGVRVRAALIDARACLRYAWERPALRWFLIAYMVYIDGLNTLFAFGGVFAAGAFKMSVSEVLLFGVAMNVAAGLGAAGFGLIQDRLGWRATIGVSLIALTLLGAALLLVQDLDWFWTLALALGLFFGPTQAASRAAVIALAPSEMVGRVYGLLALSGRATAFIGPALLATATSVTDSQRWGMAATLPFFLIGWGLLRVASVNQSDGSADYKR